MISQVETPEVLLDLKVFRTQLGESLKENLDR
jgi:hypothetical protein